MSLAAVLKEGGCLHCPVPNVMNSTFVWLLAVTILARMQVAAPQGCLFSKPLYFTSHLSVKSCV